MAPQSPRGAALLRARPLLAPGRWLLLLVVVALALLGGPACCVATSAAFLQVSASGDNACGIADAGDIRCGLLSKSDEESGWTVVAQAAPGVPFTSLSLDGRRLCATTNPTYEHRWDLTGRLVCTEDFAQSDSWQTLWGSDRDGELGMKSRVALSGTRMVVGTRSWNDYSAVVSATWPVGGPAGSWTYQPAGSGVALVSVDGAHTCATHVDSWTGESSTTVMCAQDLSPQQGGAWTTDWTVLPATAASASFTQLDLAGDTVCASTADRQVWCSAFMGKAWVQVPGLSWDWVALSGSNNTLVGLQDGQVKVAHWEPTACPGNPPGAPSGATFNCPAKTLLGRSCIASCATPLEGSPTATCQDGNWSAVVGKCSPLAFMQVSASGDTACGLTRTGAIHCGQHSAPASGWTKVPLAAGDRLTTLSLDGRRLCGMTDGSGQSGIVELKCTEDWQSPSWQADSQLKDALTHPVALSGTFIFTGAAPAGCASCIGGTEWPPGGWIGKWNPYYHPSGDHEPVGLLAAGDASPAAKMPYGTLVATNLHNTGLWMAAWDSVDLERQALPPNTTLLTAIDVAGGYVCVSTSSREVWCRPVKEPVWAQVSGLSWDSVAMSDTDNTLVGLQDGQVEVLHWDPPVVVACRGNPHTAPGNAVFDCPAQTLIGRSCTASCSLSTDGRPTAICQGDGMWGPIVGVCNPVVLDSLSVSGDMACGITWSDEIRCGPHSEPAAEWAVVPWTGSWPTQLSLDGHRLCMTINNNNGVFCAEDWHNPAWQRPTDGHRDSSSLHSISLSGTRLVATRWQSIYIREGLEVVSWSDWPVNTAVPGDGSWHAILNIGSMDGLVVIDGAQVCYADNDRYYDSFYNGLHCADNVEQADWVHMPNPPACKAFRQFDLAGGRVCVAGCATDSEGYHPQEGQPVWCTTVMGMAWVQLPDASWDSVALPGGNDTRVVGLQDGQVKVAQWELPVCGGDLPGAPDGATFNCPAQTQIGGSCVASCPPSLDGRPTARCLPNGTWSAVAGRCSPVVLEQVSASGDSACGITRGGTVRCGALSAAPADWALVGLAPNGRGYASLSLDGTRLCATVAKGQSGMFDEELQCTEDWHSARLQHMLAQSHYDWETVRPLVISVSGAYAIVLTTLGNLFVCDWPVGGIFQPTDYDLRDKRLTAVAFDGNRTCVYSTVDRKIWCKDTMFRYSSQWRVSALPPNATNITHLDLDGDLLCATTGAKGVWCKVFSMALWVRVPHLPWDWVAMSGSNNMLVGLQRGRLQVKPWPVPACRDNPRMVPSNAAFNCPARTLFGGNCTATCAPLTEGRPIAKCKGSGEWGAPVGACTPFAFTQVSASGDIGCGITSQGAIRCGPLSATSAAAEWAVASPPGTSFISLSLDGSRVCGITTLNAVKCTKDWRSAAWVGVDMRSRATCVPCVQTTQYKQISVSGGLVVFVASQPPGMIIRINLWEDNTMSGWRSVPGVLSNVHLDGKQVCGIGLGNDTLWCAGNANNPEWVQVAHPPVSANVTHVDLAGGRMCASTADRQVWCSAFMGKKWVQVPGLSWDWVALSGSDNTLVGLQDGQVKVAHEELSGGR